LWSQSQYLNHSPQNNQKKQLYKKLCSEKGGKGLDRQVSFTCSLGLDLSSFFSAHVKKGLGYITRTKRMLSEILWEPAEKAFLLNRYG